MATVRTDVRLQDHDGTYAEIVEACRDLDETRALRFFARLALLLANQVGDDGLVREAVRLARESEAPTPAGSG